MSTVGADVSSFVDPDGFWDGSDFRGATRGRGRIGAEIHAKHFARSIGPVQEGCGALALALARSRCRSHTLALRENPGQDGRAIANVTGCSDLPRPKNRIGCSVDGSPR